MSQRTNPVALFSVISQLQSAQLECEEERMQNVILLCLSKWFLTLNCPFKKLNAEFHQQGSGVV